MSASSTVSLILTGEDQGASAALDGVQGRLGGFGSMLGGLASPAALAAGAVVGIGAAVVGAGAMLFSASQETEQAMNLFAAQTGTAADELGEFESIATNIFTNNWGDSIGDVAQAMATAREQTRLTGEELENMTQSALIVRDVFGEDIASSTNAANVLMEEFGLTGEQAMDFITTGFQQGLNASGDFLDTVGEYGGLFGDAGFEADQFFNLLETGAEGGVLGTDKVADAFKEFQIRFLEGGDEMQGAVEELTGDSWQMFMDEIASGDATVSSAFETFIGQLGEIEDPLARNALQVAMFGTQAEDLGVSFTDGLSMAGIALEDMEGATERAGDAVSTGLGPAWETFKRTTLVSLMPVGDMIGEALGKATPHMETFGAWLSANAPQAMADFQTGVQVTGAALEPLGTWLGTNIPIAVQAMQDGFAVAWPIITTSTQTAYTTVSGIFGQMSDWVTGTLVPNVVTLHSNFTTGFQTISTVVTNANTVLDAIFTEWGRWLNDNLGPWVDAFGEKWDTTTTALGADLTEMWGVAEPIFTVVGDWLNVKLTEAANAIGTKWGEVMDGLGSDVERAKGRVQPIINAIQGFWNWISGKTFEFKISLPDLPEWALPGSPLPLHTRWEAFGDYLDGNKFNVDFETNMGDENIPVDPRGGFDPRGGMVASGGGVTYNIEKIEVNDAATGRLLLDWLQAIETADALAVIG